MKVYQKIINSLLQPMREDFPDEEGQEILDCFVEMTELDENELDEVQKLYLETFLDNIQLKKKF